MTSLTSVVSRCSTSSGILQPLCSHLAAFFCSLSAFFFLWPVLIQMKNSKKVPWRSWAHLKQVWKEQTFIYYLEVRGCQIKCLGSTVTKQIQGSWSGSVLMICDNAVIKDKLACYKCGIFFLLTVKDNYKCDTFSQTYLEARIKL